MTTTRKIYKPSARCPCCGTESPPTYATPFHMALSRVAVLTGALVASPELGGGDTIARKWLIARAELLELSLAAKE